MQIIIPEFSRSPYPFIVLAAVAVGFFTAVLFMRHFGVAKQTMIYTCLLAFVCTITASLFVALKITPEGISTGFSGLGAVVGMIAGLFISALIFKDKPDCVMAAFVAAAPLMYGLAKIGCLLAGCCHGKDYTGPLAVVYHGENAGSYFPAQIIDMTVFLVMFVIAAVLILKMQNKVRAILIIIGIAIPVRYVLEYFREYHDGSLIAPGQISVLVAGSLAIIIILVWKKLLKINYR